MAASFAGVRALVLSNKELETAKQFYGFGKFLLQEFVQIEPGIVRRFFQGCPLPLRRLEDRSLIQIPQVHYKVIGM